MKSIYRKTSAIVLSILLFALIFGSGFFVGNSRHSFWGNGVSAEEPLDLKSFWKVFSILEEKFVQTSEEDVIDQDKIYGAISGLVDSYNDPYTVFLPPTENEQFEETISGVFSGVGMEVGMREDFITVISPLKNSPAEKAGIKSGDKVIAIDGQSSIDMTIDDAIDLIRGEKGSPVSITVIREGEKNPITIEIIRDTIVIPTIETKIVQDTFVISLYNFSATAPSEFRDALREFVNSKKSKLILDLRGNPGGFLNSAVDITSWFLPAGKIIAIEDFGEGGDQKLFRSKGYNIFNDNLKMVILIDEGSASASEIVAGALKEHGIATLVGKNTFGKGSVQELFDITDDTSLKVTIAKWLTPEGKSISEGGLAPDIDVDFDSELFEDGIDSQLIRALEVLQN